MEIDYVKIQINSHLNQFTSHIMIHHISFHSHNVTLEMLIKHSHEIILIVYTSVYSVYSSIHFKLLYLIFNRNKCFLLFAFTGSDFSYLYKLL